MYTFWVVSPSMYIQKIVYSSINNKTLLESISRSLHLKLINAIVYSTFTNRNEPVLSYLHIECSRQDRNNSSCLFWLFDSIQDVAQRKIRFPSTHSPMDLFDKIEDVVTEMGFQVQRGPSKVDYHGVFTVTILRINATIAERN
jgi:hypothetical protein